MSAAALPLSARADHTELRTHTYTHTDTPTKTRPYAHRAATVRCWGGRPANKLLVEKHADRPQIAHLNRVIHWARTPPQGDSAFPQPSAARARRCCSHGKHPATVGLTRPLRAAASRRASRAVYSRELVVGRPDEHEAERAEQLGGRVAVASRLLHLAQPAHVAHHQSQRGAVVVRQPRDEPLHGRRAPLRALLVRCADRGTRAVRHRARALQHRGAATV